MNKLDMALECIQRLDEMGMKNIKKLIGNKKTAIGYFHMDLDGVTSFIGFKKYLESYGVKTIDAIPINYGGNEFKAAQVDADKHFIFMVDFAHGKPFVNAWTDHHDSAHVGDSKTSTSFTKTPSNIEHISQEISQRDLFPPEDIKIISMVDSADFLKNNITPDQVMNAAFGYDRTLDVERNRMMMGLVVNKLLLTYKGKKDFLSNLSMQSNASLTSMYVTIKDLAKKNGYKTSIDIKGGMEEYVTAQKGKVQPKGSNVLKLKNGESTVWGTTLVQYGGGGMFKGYDRYTTFKNNPDVDYQILGWPMGLIQVSKNPFKKGKNTIHLGDMAMKVMVAKWKSKFEAKMIPLSTIKRMFEMDIQPTDADAMGFKFEDVVALFDHKTVKGIDLDEVGGLSTFIKTIMDKKSSELEYKERQILDQITISLWDLFVAQSGGHPSITNLQGLNFWGKGYVEDVMKPIMKDLTDEMEDKHLEAE